MVKKIQKKDQSPLSQFIEIQDLQFRLDELKKKDAEIKTEIRSLAQKIPEMIRKVALQ